MKKAFFLLFASSALLMGAGCTDLSRSSNPSSSTVTQTEELPQTYTDADRGITFSLPEGWTTGTDEGGNLYTYGQSPYSTVAFEIFTDKTEWTSAQENFSANMGTDLLVKEETLTVGGFPTTMRLYQRNTGGDSFFQYGKYYVDGGTRWYVLNTSDPSEDITQIIESVRFAP